MKIFKTQKKSIVYLQKITIQDIRSIFFPKNFYEKYKYLGAIPYDDEMSMVHALVIIMDYEAKPWWCPRWVLRFLYLFGNDNSHYRVRNYRLNSIFRTLTNGICFVDYKTKWTPWDLRISVRAPDYIMDLADSIELYTWKKGEDENEKQIV